MSIDLLGLFKRQVFTDRPPERQVLVVPIHERIDKIHRQTEVQAVLAKAAEQIARSGLVWRWLCHDNTYKLCYWDASQKVFLRGSLNDWILFFGTHWRIQDTTGQEYRGASPGVMDRLIAAILLHPETPTASWAMQLQRKREAK
jgi:hypothetical protein